MTLTIILITAAVSVLCFQNTGLFTKLLLNPYRTFREKEWWRLISHGFVHADWTHLIVNMFVLYSFGRATEGYFSNLVDLGYIRSPMLHFFLLYFGGMLVASIPSMLRHRNDPNYNSVGASGAVSAVVFTSIFFSPLQNLYLYFIPMPGIVFGILYLVYSQVMARRASDNVNHEAHFTGAVFGLVYPILLEPGLAGYFIRQFDIF